MLAESPSASGSTPARVLYLSAEESPRQVRDRAKRLGVASSRIDVLSDPEVASCAELVEKAGYRALVVDSIQTVHLASVPGEAGGVVQVRACALRLLQLAKQANVAVVLVGHVTKDNQLAGPRTLEHLVDVVLTLEGETLGEARWLSGTKNRFGPNETGAFRMTAAGFQPLGVRFAAERPAIRG
jgi:DNA repair protein RadA/Sms